MRWQYGFTLIELMVVIVIVGILGATAIPVYNTWLQRAHGQEASLMVRQILDAQILYYLEHDSFYPENMTPIIIDHNNVGAQAKDIEDALKIAIPKGHQLNYMFSSYKIPEDYFQIWVWADFPLFKGGKAGLYGTVNSAGETDIFTEFE